MARLHKQIGVMMVACWFTTSAAAQDIVLPKDGDVCGADGDAWVVTDEATRDALRGCRHLRGTLRIETEELTSLDGLEDLVVVDGDFDIVHNDALVDIDALHQLQHVGGVVHASRNRALTRLALPRLLQAQRMVITENPSLARVAAPQLHALPGALIIVGNGSDDAAPGCVLQLQFDALVDVGDTLVISANATLQQLHGLAALRRVAGPVWVEQNSRLPKAAALTLLQDVHTPAHTVATRISLRTP